MRQPTILDVVRAVTDAAGKHEDVRQWWYAPARRFRLAGEARPDHPSSPLVEVVIEPWPGAAPNCDAIAATLARTLGIEAVRVRLRSGDEGLYRLYSRSSRPKASIDR